MFAENEIDFGILPKLTEAHLEKLGIAMGPRIKLLEAIAAPSDEDIDTGIATEEASGPIAPPTASQAERRQLTVMFVDLVGSTLVSGQKKTLEMAQVDPSRNS